MILMANNYLCVAKENVDFSRYGFIRQKGEWIFSLNNTKRITVKKDGIMRFNNVSIDVLMVFSKLVKDEVIYFQRKEDSRTRSIVVSPKEYQLIMELRDKKRGTKDDL